MFYQLDDTLYDKFEAECSTKGCTGHRVLELNTMQGIKVGDPVPSNTEYPDKDRCPLCMKMPMIICRVPQAYMPEEKTGWWNR